MNLFNQLGDFLSNAGEQATYFSLITKINFLYEYGKFDEAFELAEQSLSLARKIWGNEHKNVAITLNNLAVRYGKQEKYSQAEPLFQEALAIRRGLFKSDHPNVVTSLSNLAHLYDAQGKYGLAEPLYQELLGIRQDLFPDSHPDVATSLSDLAENYANQGKYSLAEPLFQEALGIRQEVFPKDDPDVVNSLINLAKIYEKQGKYSLAKPFFQEALAMMKHLYKDNLDPVISISSSFHLNLNKLMNVTNGLISIAKHYEEQGKYSQAEPLLIEALAMRSKLFPDEDSFEANMLLVSNVAKIYSNQGKYSQAEPFFQEALALSKGQFPNGHPSVSESLNNLALFYINQKEYSKAEPFLQDALNMSRNLFPDNHPNVAAILNNLAILYSEQGKYSQAESYCQEALDMRKSLFPGNHRHVANSLNNFGVTCYYQGKYSQAESYYQDAVAMFKCLFKSDHPDVAGSLNNLAVFFAGTNRHQQALKSYKESTEVEHRLMNQEFLGSSENTRMLFLDNIRKTQYRLLSLVYKYFYPLAESPEKSEAIHTALDLVLKRKAISNAADAAFNAAMNSDRYPHLQDSFQTYRSLWKQIVNLQSSLYLPENSSRLEANEKLLKELYVEVETIQKKLSAEVPEMRLENQLVDRQAIALELPENSTLIEFAYFPVYDFTTRKYQTRRYLAFILPAKEPEKVQMIDLGEAEKIDNLISLVRQAISLPNQENMGIATKKVKLGTSEPSNPFIELTTTVFEPLKEYLQGEQLFICPDGKLTLIPFEILPVDGDNNRLFIDKYQITYLTAARDLLRYKNQPKRTASESLVIADPNFDLSVEIPPTPLGKGGL